MSSIPGRPDVPARTRTLALVLLTLVVLAFALVLDPVVEGAMLRHRTKNVEVLGRFLSLLGTGLFYVPLLLLLAARGYLQDDRGDLRRAGHAIVALLLTAVASPTLKSLFGRVRPNGFDAGDFHPISFTAVESSFPSGHSMAAFALAGALAAGLAWRHRAWIYGVALLVPIARILAGRHFLADVIAGSLTGWLMARWAPVVVARVEVWRERRRGRGPESRVRRRLDGA
jgi:membrane-associated phospholipid phosphatase